MNWALFWQVPLSLAAIAAPYLLAVGFNPLSEARWYRRLRRGTWFRSTGLLPQWGTRWHRTTYPDVVTGDAPREDW